jgi:hypothetical protein
MGSSPERNKRVSRRESKRNIGGASTHILREISRHFQSSTSSTHGGPGDRLGRVLIPRDSVWKGKEIKLRDPPNQIRGSETRNPMHKEGLTVK